MKIPFFSKPEVAPPVDVEAVARQVAKDTAKEILNGPAAQFSEVINGMAVERRSNVQMYAQNAYSMNDPRRFTDMSDPRLRPYSLLTVDSLRRLAETYDVLASCNAHLKDQVLRTPLYITAKDDKDKSEKTIKDLAAARVFFDTEGGLGGLEDSRFDFEGKWLDDLLVIGAAALLPNYQTVGAKVDGSPDEVLVIDASTIRPLVTPYGFSPDIQDDVYEQYVQGQMMCGFTRDELIYRGLPIFGRTHTPYFTSATELLAVVVMTALKSDEWNRTWLTDGNVPDSLIQVPKEWTPDQISDYAEYFDALLSGNSSMRHKAKVVPEGVHGSAQSRKEADFQAFMEWLRDRACSLSGVNPASIGFHGRQYKDSQENAAASTRDNRVAMLLLFRNALYTDICRRKGWATIHVTEQQTDAEDAKTKAERHEIELRSGVSTPNEIRQQMGRDPYPESVLGGDAFFVPANLVTMEKLMDPTPEPVAPVVPIDSSASDLKQNMDGVSDVRNQPEDSTNRSGMLTDLQRWERKCLNRLSSGKGVACGFDSEFLSNEVAFDVNEGLKSVSTKDEVRRLFDGVIERHVVERAEADPLAAWSAEDLEELCALDKSMLGPAAQRATGKVQSMAEASG